MTIPTRSGNTSHSGVQPTGAQMTAVVIYENLRTLPNTSLHLAFDCQLYGVPKRALDSPIVANLRYFNVDHLAFSKETGAMVVKADITRWEPNAPLHLTSCKNDGEDAPAEEHMELTEKDFSIIGDIKWVLPLTSVEDTFDFDKIHAPMISAAGVVVSSQDQLVDHALAIEGKVAVFEFTPTQYTSYFAHDSVLRTLPIKAFFRLSNRRYEHGAPLPHPGRIVRVDGFLYDIHYDTSTGSPTCFVIEVEDIANLGQGTLPQSGKLSKAVGQGSRKRKFAFDPVSMRSATPAATTSSSVSGDSASDSAGPAIPADAGDSTPGASSSTPTVTRGRNAAGKRARKD